jgi:hypothetical protein
MSVFDSQFITFVMNLYSYHFADSGFSGCYLKLFFDFAKEKLFNSILIYSIQSLASCLELFSRSLLLFLFLKFLVFNVFKHFDCLIYFQFATNF